MRLPVVIAAVAMTLSGCTSQVDGQAQRSSGPSVASSSNSSTGSPAAPDAEPSGSSGPDEGDGPIEGKIPEPTPGGSGAGAIPAGLEGFYNQKLDWQDCRTFSANPDLVSYFAADGIDCANLIVPLDYADPAGQTVSIGVLRATATGPDRIGSVQVNPGGPGASGVDTVAVTQADEKWKALHESFDLIGFDTRGVGASRPLVSCQTDAEKDAARAANYRTTTPEGVAAITASVTTYAAQCVARTGQDAGVDGADFLVTLGTADAVKDMDVLRSVLGEAKLTYLGFSYGTLLGTVYAEQFTDNVRAMVLDGAVDPAKDPAQSAIDQYSSFQSTFEAFATWCTQQKSCVLGTDPSASTAALQTLLHPLLDTPLPLADGRTLTFADAITGVGQAMYSEQLWPTLRTALLNVATGNGTRLMSLADYYDGRDSIGHYSNLLDVFNAVNCMNYARSDAESDAQTMKQINEEAPFQASGDPIVAYPNSCSLWPGQPTLTPGPADAPGVAPLVVISTTGDPATPYDDGVALAQQLGASLITVQGDSHTAYLSAGDACVDDAATTYLVDLTLPEDGLTCQ